MGSRSHPTVPITISESRARFFLVNYSPAWTSPGVRGRVCQTLSGYGRCRSKALRHVRTVSRAVEQFRVPAEFERPFNMYSRWVWEVKPPITSRDAQTPLQLKMREEGGLVLVFIWSNQPKHQPPPVAGGRRKMKHLFEGFRFRGNWSSESTSNTVHSLGGFDPAFSQPSVGRSSQS